jgi:hypothetical protein
MYKKSREFLPGFFCVLDNLTVTQKAFVSP